LVALLVGLTLAKLLPADIATELVEPGHIAVFFGGTGVLFGALTVAFALAIRLIHGKRFRDVAGVWRWTLVMRGAALWLAVCILAAIGDYLIEPHGFRLTASGATLTLVIWVLPSLAVQTFAEEFIFRGYLTQALFLATRRPLVTAMLSGLAFALLHIPNGWPQAASAAAFGAVTALIAIRTGGIAFTFGLHLANNVFGAVIVVSANDVFRGAPALVTQSTPDLMWLDAAVPMLAFAAALWVVGVRPGWAAARVSPRPS
jgi:membrane protease YdiL (CAAX protease family)